ncbi:uncharacterized protein LOC142849753 [Microtus pennsylvanicus]|uniref:uncharacterized protein LOC142849753 n=1 Tax=Microtus pennsylvanicus TaxID=10058 RepID=UPI003F6D824D
MTAVCVPTSRISAWPGTYLQTSRTVCPATECGQGRGDNETKVSEEELRFLALAGEAASSFPQPRGSLGLAPGTWATARLTASPGSEAQRAPASPTTAVTPAPTPPPTSSTPRAAARCQRDSPASALRGSAHSADDWPLGLAFWPPLPTSLDRRSPRLLVSLSGGRSGLSNCCLPEMPAGMRVGGARRLPASSVLQVLRGQSEMLTFTNPEFCTWFPDFPALKHAG